MHTCVSDNNLLTIHSLIPVDVLENVRQTNEVFTIYQSPD